MSSSITEFKSLGDLPEDVPKGELWFRVDREAGVTIVELNKEPIGFFKNKQENNMQKFENGQEVNCDIGMNHDNWVIAEYYSFDDKSKMHIVWIDGEISGVSDENIRPVQLICDEAREYIITCDKTKNYLFKVDSEAQSKELLRMLFDCGICWGDGTIEMKYTGDVSEYDCYCVNNKRLFRQDNMITATDYNELNLKTGDVIPFVDDKEPSSRDFEKALEYQLGVNRKQKDRIKALLSSNVEQLCKFKEKDTEIERLENRVNILEEVNEYNTGRIKCKDTEIEQFAVEMKNIRNLANASYQRNKGSM